MAKLALFQRIQRRVALLGGSYTHPDGSIELDFEAEAGVDHYGDAEEVKQAKVGRLWEKQARVSRVSGAAFVGLGVYVLTRHDAPAWQLLGGAVAVATGLYQVSR